jgi:RNA polymerase sigma factor (sigma-70 family)
MTPLRIPPAEQLALVARAQAGDRSAQTKLVRSMLARVHQHAYALARRSRLLDADDFVQLGAMGVLRAIEKFNPDAGASFATYSEPWIRAFMTTALYANAHPLSGNGRMLRLAASGRLTREMADARTQGVPEDAIDAHIANLYTPAIRPSTIAAARVFLLSPRSLDAPVQLPEGETTLLDLTPDPQEAADTQIAHEELASRFRTALAAFRQGLNDRHRRVLDARLHLDTRDQEALMDVGNALGVSRERVRQIEKQVMTRLRKTLSHDTKLIETAPASVQQKAVASPPPAYPICPYVRRHKGRCGRFLTEGASLCPQHARKVAERRATRQGRPPLPPEDRLSERFSMRCSETERARIAAAAARAGLAPSEWARRIVIAACAEARMRLVGDTG